MYIFDWIKIIDQVTQTSVLTLKENDYQEISAVVPKVRKLHKIHVIQKLQSVTSQKSKITPIICEMQPDTSIQSNSLLARRMDTHAHLR